MSWSEVGLDGLWQLPEDRDRLFILRELGRAVPRALTRGHDL